MSFLTSVHQAAKQKWTNLRSGQAQLKDKARTVLTSTADRLAFRKFFTSSLGSLFIYGVFELLFGLTATVLSRKEQNATVGLPYFNSLLTTCIPIPVFASIVFWKIRKGTISREALKYNWKAFCCLGFLNAFVMMGRFLAADLLGASSGPLIQLLNQLVLPSTVALSYIFLKKKYSISQYIGVTIILGGVMIIVLPLGVFGSNSGISIPGILLQIGTNIPYALIKLGQQHILEKADYDVFLMGLRTRLYSVPWVIMGSILVSLSKGQGVAGYGDELSRGSTCLFSKSPQSCNNALVLVIAYNMANTIDLILILSIIKKASALFFTMLNALALPLANIVFASRAIMGSNAKPVTAYTIFGLVFITVGMMCYGVLGKEHSGQMFALFIAHIGICIILSFFITEVGVDLKEFRITQGYWDLAIYFGLILLVVLGMYLHLAPPGSRFFFLRRRVQWLWPRVKNPLSIGEFGIISLYVAAMACWVGYWVDHRLGVHVPVATGLETFAATIGRSLELHLGILLLPVTRNSVWVAVFGIPFDRAIKWHRWLGLSFVIQMTAHMLSWFILWGSQGSSGVCAVISTWTHTGFPACGLSGVQCVSCAMHGGSWIPKDPALLGEAVTAPISFLENAVTHNGFYVMTRGNKSIVLVELAWVLLVVSTALYLWHVNRQTYNHDLFQARKPRNTGHQGSLTSFKGWLHRSLGFEAFYFFHHIMFITVISFAVVHDISVRSYFVLRYLLVPLPLYALDRFIRWRRGQRCHATVTSIRILDDAVKLTIRATNFVFHTGQYVFVNVPELAHLQWHPFSIACAPPFPRDPAATDSEIQLVIRQGNSISWTRRLRKLSEGYTLSPEHLQVRLDGPYGNPALSYLSYDAIILVAGGVGATATIPLLQDIFVKMLALRANEASNAVALNKVTWVWVVRKYENLLWFETTLKTIMAEESLKDKFTIQLYVSDDYDHEHGHRHSVDADGYNHHPAIDTPLIDINVDSARPAADGATEDELGDASNTAVVTTLPHTSGRPNIDDCFADVINTTTFRADRVGVFTCGPRSLVDEVASQSIFHSQADNGCIFDYHWEQYSL